MYVWPLAMGNLKLRFDSTINSSGHLPSTHKLIASLPIAFAHGKRSAIDSATPEKPRRVSDQTYF